MKKKRNTKSRVSDILVTLFCMGGASFSLYLFWQDFNMVMSRLNEKPIATVTWKKKASQRKFSDRLIWDRLQQNADIYNGDTIRTAADAETTITFTDSVIELAGSTIIQVKVDEYGAASVDLSGGTLSATAGNSGTLQLKSGNVTVDLERGSSISAVTAAGGGQTDSMLQLQVTQGNAIISDGEGIHSVQQGGAVNVTQSGQVQSRMITVTEPKTQARVLNFSENAYPVRFSWGTNNLPANATVMLEVAYDKKFTDIHEQVSTSGLRNMTVTCNPGIHYWRIYATDNGQIIQDSITEGRLNILSAPAPTAIVPEQEDRFYYRTKLPSLRFMWKGNEHAARYLFEVANNSDMRNPIIQQNCTMPSSIVSTLGAGRWYWRVTPYYTINGLGYTEPSQTYFFVIERQDALSAPTPISPANAGFVNIVQDNNDNVPVFSWQKENDADHYTVKVASDQAMRNVLATQNTSNNYIPIRLPSTGRYYWTVTQTDVEGNESPASSVQSFMAIDQEIEFEPIFPPNNYSIAQSMLLDTRFTWKTNLPDTIKFQIATDSNFTSLVHEETLPKGTQGTDGRRLNVGTYYWRLLCGTKNEQITTHTRQIKVVSQLGIPQQQNPKALSRVIVRPGQEVTFSWAAVTGAHYYHVELYIDDGSRKEEQESVYHDLYVEGTETTIVFDELPAGSYRWAVQAFADETALSSRLTGQLAESYFNLTKIYPIQIESPDNGTKFAGYDAFFNPASVSFSTRSPVVNAELVIAKGSRNILPKEYGEQPSKTAGGTIVYRGTIEGTKAKMPQLNAGTYWFTVNAKSVGDLDISCLMPRTFTVEPIKPFAPVEGANPPDKTRFDETYLVDKLTAQLSWQGVKDAQAYHLLIQNADNNNVLQEMYIPAQQNQNKLQHEIDLSQLGIGNYKWTVTAKRFMPGENEKPMETREVLQDGTPVTQTFSVFLPQEEIYVYDPGDLYGN